MAGVGADRGNPAVAAGLGRRDPGRRERPERTRRLVRPADDRFDGGHSHRRLDHHPAFTTLMPATQTAAEPVAVAAHPDQAATGRRAARSWLAAARQHGRAYFVAAGLADVLAAAGTVLGCWNIATLIVAWVGPG